MEHLRKILKTSDYFLVKFELILSIEVKSAFKKIGEKLQNCEKQILESRENFLLNVGEAVENL